MQAPNVHLPGGNSNRWLTTNPWFEKELLPELQEQIRKILGSTS